MAKKTNPRPRPPSKPRPAPQESLRHDDLAPGRGSHHDPARDDWSALTDQPGSGYRRMVELNATRES